MTGIICAMEIEAQNILNEMTDTTSEVLSGSKYTRGKLNGSDCVVAVCGIGKVHAAICAQTMIFKYSPNEIVNVGVAGSLSDELRVFDIVISRDLVQHDYDLTAFGYPMGKVQGFDDVAFKASDRMIAKLERVISEAGLNYRVGRIASGDVFVDTEADRRAISDAFGAIACEMEGASIAQVCAVNGVEFAVLRAISDSGEGDYGMFAEKAALNSAKIICNYLK